MKASWKPLEMSLLIRQSENGQQILRLGERLVRMMDCLTAKNMSGLKKYDNRAHPGFV